eukprot:7227763-Pyramimonas_sp.AAC.1
MGGWPVGELDAARCDGGCAARCKLAVGGRRRCDLSAETGKHIEVAKPVDIAPGRALRTQLTTQRGDDKNFEGSGPI